MPIYAYRCGQCGHELDTLQKLSDPALVDCPACGAPALAKQVTAAGFQLKGSGWYQTDFRGGAKPGAKEAPASETKSDAPAAAATAEGKGDGKGEAKQPAAPAPTVAPAAPAPASSGSGTGSTSANT